MNVSERFSGFRLGRVVAAAGVLAMVMTLAPGAQASDKVKTKKKKNEDLSANPLANVKSRQPDKELFDKAMNAMKKGRYDVARLDLQTLLNTYPESEYKMRAKLAVGDSWFKEGGSAALTQAESEYNDFITFFPQAAEAAEAQMKVGDIYFMQMEKPDRDYSNAQSAEREYRRMINQFPDSVLVPKAKQKLREVQEVLAEREFLIGQYYSSKENWAGGSGQRAFAAGVPGQGCEGLCQGDYAVSDGSPRGRCAGSSGGDESAGSRAEPGSCGAE